ncbi:MAG: hypothetical protein ACE5E5_03475 [Phycisphaerae bacterium]
MGNDRRRGGAAGSDTVQLVFDVLRVELPEDAVRHSRKVWNHVDSLRLDAQVASRLARNGIRVGAGTPDAWPAIEAIFNAAGAAVSRSRLTADAGALMSVVLGTIEEPESFFFYDFDNRLVGKTFDRGEKTLNLENIILRELGGRVDLALSFEIRHDAGDFRWDKTREGITAVPTVERHVFGTTRVSLALAPGEFVVVGPSDEAENEYLVGGRFFLGDSDGNPRETMLCIVPKVLRTAASE